MENDLLQPPYVSVAMATYNGAKYISEQLDSILLQSCPADEIVVVDDCSTDDTFAILQTYAIKYSHIKIYQNEVNLGVCKTFERALSLTKGCYIALSDQDDVWESNKLKTLLDSIEDNLLVYSLESYINDNSEIIGNNTTNFSNLTFFDYLIKNRVRGCCVLMSHKIIEYMMPINFYVHDHYFALLASSLNKIRFIQDQLVRYRIHDSNTIGTKKYSYDKFILNSLSVGKSYHNLLSMNVFAQYFEEISLIRDYRISIGNGRFFGCGNLMKLLTKPKGFQLIIYYFLVGGVFGKKLSRKIYNLIHGL